MPVLLCFGVVVSAFGVCVCVFRAGMFVCGLCVYEFVCVIRVCVWFVRVCVCVCLSVCLCVCVFGLL